MYLLKKRAFLSPFIFSLLIIFAISTKANPGGFTDEEITGFVNAYTKVTDIQQQSQMQMVEVIEEHDMDVQRFNLLYMQMQQMPIEEIDGTDKEKEDMADIIEEIEKIQLEIETVLIKTIEDEGLTIDKYTEIMNEIQQNPELQQRIQQEME